MKRIRSIFAVAALVGMFTASTATAAPYILSAVQDQSAQAPDSTFALDFAGNGGVRDSEISNTTFGMEIDFDNETASFTNYSQQIGSILLPNSTGPDVATGPITVSIIPGSEPGRLIDNGDGTFNFETTDTYEITFTNDLSMFGFPGQSVLLPSTSIGTLTIDSLRDDVIDGTAAMVWEDDSFMLDPSTIDPQNPILLPFHYACNINSVFTAVAVPEPASAMLLGLGAVVALRRRS